MPAVRPPGVLPRATKDLILNASGLLPLLRSRENLATAVSNHVISCALNAASLIALWDIGKVFHPAPDSFKDS